MMKEHFFREYRFKFYLNMNHFIVIDGKEGQTHPHTWEFVFVILKEENVFIQFSTYEKLIENFLNQYQEKIINEIEPFQVVIPTIENVTDYFSSEIGKRMRGYGGELVSVEGSETPTRSYIVNFQNDPDFISKIDAVTEEKISRTIDTVLDDILQD